MRFRSTFCNDCWTAKNKKWLEASPRNLLTASVRAAARRCEKIGAPCNITVDYMLELYAQQKGCCAYSGIPMTTAVGSRDLVSLDRVDATKSYTKGNVVLAARFVNMMKSNLSVEVFLDTCHRITTHAKPPP
jgi:hypothetical protein